MSEKWDADERRADRRWQRRPVHPEINIGERMAVFDLVQLELAFAVRMLRENLDRETVKSLLIGMRHSGDANMVLLSSDETQADATVSLAEFRLGRGFFLEDADE
jgi:hypothetical protein